jgi:methionyl-tRNA formyltransferase
MRICYFGNDGLNSCLQWFIEQNYEVFLVCVSDKDNCALQTISFAHNQQIPVFDGLPSQELMQQILEAQCDFIFVADYQHKIPVDHIDIPIVNCHQSLLPHGRGAVQLPYLISTYQQYAGLTLHKVSSEFDQGDIILQTPIRVEDTDTIDTLLIKMYLEAPILLAEFMANFDGLYANAKPQGEGSYWPIPKVEKRVLDWQLNCEQLTRLMRQYASYGVYLKLDNQLYLVTSIQTKQTTLVPAPGNLVYENVNLLAISCADGFVVIDKKNLIQLNDANA